MIDINAMLLFAKVVEARSYSQAARDAGIPKSTISRKISQMEEELGVRLLQRNTRSLHLTQVGEEVYQNCRNILNELQQVHASIESAKEEVAGSLRVMFPVSFNQHLCARLCAGYMKRYPKVSLEIQFADGELDLIAQGVDIAVMYGPLSSSDYVARLLFERRRLLLASPAYLKLHGEPAGPEELARHQGLLLGNQNSAPIWPLGRGGNKRLQSFIPRVRVNSNEALRQLALDGLGIAMLTEAQCREDLQKGALQQVLPELEIEPVQAYGVYSSRYQLAPKIARFLDYFANNVDGQEFRGLLGYGPLKSVSAT